MSLIFQVSNQDKEMVPHHYYKRSWFRFYREILFNGVECVIFEDRTDTEIKILPPSLGELGKTIQEVRTIMNEGKSIGLPIEDIKLVRRNRENAPNITK